MKAVPIISPIVWPPARDRAGVIGRFLYHLSYRRKARIVYDSIRQQLAARPSPAMPWTPDSVEADVASILAENLNRHQFFGTYSYHSDDALLLLSVHPVDDMAITEATSDLEIKLRIKIKQDLHIMTFGEAVCHVASLVREKKAVA